MSKRLVSIVVALVLIFAIAIPAAAQDKSEKPSGHFEIFSWWSGDEGPALEALIAKYNEMYPDVNVINSAVTGGAGVNARAVLKTRMLGGDPPDSFQVHAGWELIGTYVVADRMEPLNFLFEEEDWMDKFPQGLIDLLSYDGHIWSVPANIHRSNVLWYIPANLEKWGIEAPTTWDDFLTECPILQDIGITPLVVGESWTVQHLWENVMVSELGADGWKSLWAGDKKFTDDDVVAAWDKFGQILDCTNIDIDAATLSWQQAIDKVVTGEAAFNVMGDWAAGYMDTTLGLEPGVGFGYMPSPGTEGIFVMLSDSFGLPKDIGNRPATLAWLKLLGSVEGQDLFNPLKGSIAARLDSNLSLYNTYSQDAAKDWQSNVIVGSLVHGAVAPESFSSEFATVMEIFLNTRDAATVSAAAQDLADQAGIGGGM